MKRIILFLALFASIEGRGQLGPSMEFRFNSWGRTSGTSTSVGGATTIVNISSKTGVIFVDCQGAKTAYKIVSFNMVDKAYVYGMKPYDGQPSLTGILDAEMPSFSIYKSKGNSVAYFNTKLEK